MTLVRDRTLALLLWGAVLTTPASTPCWALTPTSQAGGFSLSGVLWADHQHPDGEATVTVTTHPSHCEGEPSVPVSDPHGQVQKSAAVDEAGAFEITELPAGVYSLRICLDAGQCFDVAPRPLVSSENLGPILLRSDGAPEHPSQLALSPTTFAVRAERNRAGATPAEERPAASPGSEALFRGVVRDLDSGEAVRGAYVWLGDDAGCFARTGPGGEYSLAALDATGGILHAVAPGYLGATVRLEEGHRSQPQEVAMRPARGALAGRVQSSWNQPLPDAFVFLPAVGRWGRAGADGSFSVPRLPFPGKVEVAVSAPGFETTSVVLRTAPPSAVRSSRVVHLESVYRVTGEVRDAAGQPVEGVRIWAVGNLPGEFATLTGPSGRFSLSLPRAGRFGLRAAKQGFPQADFDAPLSPEEPRLDLGVLRLGGALQLWGVVRSAGGEPLGGVEVFDTGVRGSASRDEISGRPLGSPLTRTGDDGVFECIIEREGRQSTHLELWREGFVPAQEEVSLHQPELPLLLFLEESFELTGKVVNRSGDPVAGAIVTLDGGRPEFVDSGARQHLRTDSEGEFRVSSLSSGQMRLVIAVPGHATAVREVDEEPLEDDLDLRIVLQPEAQVRGQVVDGAGRPVPGIVVQVLLPGTPLMPGLVETSDEDGRFHLFSLPTGPARFELTDLSRQPSLRMHEEVVLLPGVQELEFRWHGAKTVPDGRPVPEGERGEGRRP